MAKKKPPEAPDVGPKKQVSVISLKGTPAYRDWLAAESKRTHIPAAAIVRLGLALWADSTGATTPPER